LFYISDLFAYSDKRRQTNEALVQPFKQADLLTDYST